jgi:hypothetical protein
MTNILTAIYSIKRNYNEQVQNVTTGNNIMNIMGDGLEKYIKKAFASVLGETDERLITQGIQNSFSYTCNKTTYLI